MTDNTRTTTDGGANTRNTQYSGRGAENSRRGGRGGRGCLNNTGHGGGRSSGGGQGQGNQHNLTKKSSHSGQIQSGCMKGIVVSSDGNRATQYKILKDAIPVFCADKGYHGVGGIVYNMKDWEERTFYPNAPNNAERRTYSTPYRTHLCEETVTRIKPQAVQARDIDGNPSVDDEGSPIMVFENREVHRQIPIYGEKWVVTDESLQKITLGKYERTVRELEKKWYRCQEEKKLVIDMI